MTSVKKGKGGRSDDTMEDDSDEIDSKRKCRNLSEKKRRDQFNLLVNELNSMVSAGGRKMDKSTVLKATIAFLKNHNEITVQSQVHEIKEDWKPSFLTNEEFIHLVLEAIDGFIIAFSTSGQIYYASESLSSLFGYKSSDILNRTIFDITSEEEQTNLYNTLLNRTEQQDQISFSCHLMNSPSNSMQEKFFEMVNFVGYIRSDDTLNQIESGYGENSEARFIFVGTGRLHRPQLLRESSLVGLYKNEFTSRHSLEWKFLFLDHRAPPIIGYLPFELLGTSGYDYYHVDDLEDIINCHEALMQKGEGTSCHYRFLTKGQQWIWLQSRFYITYHQWNSKPEFIVCMHRVISYSDVLKQKNKTQENISNIDTSNQYSSNESWSNKFASRDVSDDTNCSSCRTMPTDPNKTNVSSLCASQSNQCNLINIPNQSKFLQPLQYAENSQYITSIQVPVQPVISSFPVPAVVSPLPSEITQERNIIHADLQRKHAELQASIGQQQAELRAVSEQLIMARLGLIPTQTQTSQANMSTYSYSCSGTVSSTTTFAGSIITAVVPTVALVQSLPESEVLTPLVPVQTDLNSSQINSLYLLPDSNTPPTFEELK